MLNSFDETYDVFPISIITPFSDKAVSFNPSHKMANDDLAMQGAKESVITVLT